MDVANPTSPTPVRIFMLDDHEIVRRAIAAMLDDVADFEVVGEAGEAAQALGRVQACRPDVAILDLHLPDGSGIDVCRDIRATMPDTYCIALTSDTSPDAVLAAVLAGASAFVRKEVRPASLVDTIRQVSQGRSVLDLAVVGQAMDRARQLERDKGELSQLSPREREVLDLIAEGLTNRDIAGRLFLAEKTVKNYVTSLLGKLGMQRRTQAAVFRAGLTE